MQKFVTLYHPELEGGKCQSDITRVPEIVKAHPQGCFRGTFFKDQDQRTESGPLTLVFAIRRARDLLLEGCDYHGMELQIEAAGQVLPQLPVAAELMRVLNAQDTLVHVNGSVFKTTGEVFGFQQVYDDAVHCIEALKRLGFTQETMAIHATPEEICVEVHGGATGCGVSDNPGEFHYRLLGFVAGIKAVGNRPVKHEVKTILLNSCQPSFQVLLPGSNHPSLHRPKVGVGASHFAYGIAAFSDFCGKKRSLQECLQETFAWVKFVQAEMPPIPGLQAKVEKMPLPPMPGAAGTVAASGSARHQAPTTGFQPLKNRISQDLAFLQKPPAVYNSLANGLDKTLGGGWLAGGIHIIAGPRESGKATMLMQQAFVSEKKMPVLFVSYEQNLREFMLRAVSMNSGVNYNETLGHLPLAGSLGETARSECGAAVEKLLNEISPTLYFSGVENTHDGFDPHEFKKLAEMIPGDREKLVIIESACKEDFADEFAPKMRQLREIAAAGRLTFIISCHYPIASDKRPHFIEETDIEILEKFQRHTDSLLIIETERNNLRRFVAMIKGQIDAQLVSSLEQKALQTANNKRFKTDTYSLMRLIHNRLGRRDLLLFLYQPEVMRFFELASLAMSRP
ncbi:MAG TPA: DnaB-like helicase C-terminal domain-containing protein [Candidatus Rifleibacterium sp.]|nr:DnaB-like helicase C-terminal domain-containing protein [Candidatus Rifleibacterium sp.]HPT46977.1 DnaB-like helicase C-terminal domain-containing protein [Candidatus Rifleibacterium sp.]